jgi:hypothetical protein
MAGSMANRPDGFPLRGEAGGIRWLGPLGSWINRRLNAPAAADPLYLSNRTLGQKLRVWIPAALPCLVVAVVVYLGLAGRFASQTAPTAAPAVVPPAEVAARMLPNLGDLTVKTNHDLEVLDAHIVHGATTAIEGTVRNNTARHIDTADLVFDLTDASGSQLGGASGQVNDLKPHAQTPFKLPIRQPKAAFALVRELRAM